VPLHYSFSSGPIYLTGYFHICPMDLLLSESSLHLRSFSRSDQTSTSLRWEKVIIITYNANILGSLMNANIPENFVDECVDFIITTEYLL
jgi:hypothetical protein